MTHEAQQQQPMRTKKEMSDWTSTSSSTSTSTSTSTSRTQPHFDSTLCWNNPLPNQHNMNNGKYNKDNNHVDLVWMLQDSKQEMNSLLALQETRACRLERTVQELKERLHETKEDHDRVVAQLETVQRENAELRTVQHATETKLCQLEHMVEAWIQKWDTTTDTTIQQKMIDALVQDHQRVTRELGIHVRLAEELRNERDEWKKELETAHERIRRCCGNQQPQPQQSTLLKTLLLQLMEYSKAMTITKEEAAAGSKDGSSKEKGSYLPDIIETKPHVGKGNGKDRAPFLKVRTEEEKNEFKWNEMSWERKTQLLEAIVEDLPNVYGLVEIPIKTGSNHDCVLSSIP